ncbi:MAG: phosphoribosylanthranilate isomerase [Bacteroides sp.]|nr:phosphoribosylanthranilate isomerase [Roseburia sp.]MCM1346831.1 phosphoribosylanthranilate isomerase [Bacteroides sp.]MCM1420643.1 phosphoribosylanthranilate isomerase [Bacteroides sp.]
MIIKVCGLREADNIKDIEALGADWTGFIFYPRSLRHITSRPSFLPAKAKRVGVFVNEQIQNILQKVSEFRLDIIQLHGNETPDFCMELKGSLPNDIQIMKAIQIEKEEDVNISSNYRECTDYILFETKCHTYGGSGRQFNWQWLQSYKGPQPFILSGGIGPDDAPAIKRIEHPRFLGIDLNSRFESSPGIKDTRLLGSFLQELRK